MKFAHLSDLHLGITLMNHSLVDDQRFVLEEIIQVLVGEKVDALLVAGDVYDRSIPSVEAVHLLDTFLTSLAEHNIPVYMIAGNHDNGERLSFGNTLFQKTNIHMIGNYEGSLTRFDLNDAYGPIHVYCLPFIRPAYVNRYIEDDDKKVKTYTEAMKYVLENAKIQQNERNVLVAHQFLAGANVDVSGSEDLIVGGLDQIDVNTIHMFDYVALGHIHRPQKVKKETIRYAGTPLAYSFAEANQTKSMPIIDIKEKGNIQISYIPLKPYREMVERKGTYSDFLKKDWITQYQNAYLHITLTDRHDIANALQVLRNQYHYLLKLDYEKDKETTVLNTPKDDIKQKSPVALFEDFFYLQNQKNLSKTQKEYITETIDTVVLEVEDETN